MSEIFYENSMGFSVQIENNKVNSSLVEVKVILFNPVNLAVFEKLLSSIGAIRQW